MNFLVCCFNPENLQHYEISNLTCYIRRTKCKQHRDLPRVLLSANRCKLGWPVLVKPKQSKSKSSSDLGDK